MKYLFGESNAKEWNEKRNNNQICIIRVLANLINTIDSYWIAMISRYSVEMELVRSWKRTIPQTER